ncbi:MAG TPA: choice-of-anchor D domain-containing protein, partial [bacterium]
MKWFITTISLGLSTLLGPAISNAQPIPVSLPETESTPGSMVSIPLIVGNLSGRSVFSYSALIQFDPTVLAILPPTSTGTLSEIFGPPSYELLDTLIIIRGVGTTPLSGSGSLVNLNFAVIGQPGQTSILRFVGFLFNTGIPGAIVSDGKFTVKSEPDIEVSPVRLDFGDVVIDATASGPIRIRNRGTANLRVLDLTITGTNFEQFQVDGIVLPLELAPGDSQRVLTSFRPTSPGPKVAELVIFSNDADEDTVAVSLLGNALTAPAPDIEVIPLLHDFGSVALGGSASQTLIVLNAGTGDLTVNSASFVGSDVDQFLVLNGSAPFTLAPGDSAKLLLG